MMWSTVSDNLPQVIAALTAVVGCVGAWIKLRPRRIIGWFTAVKEREMLLAMLEQEKNWGAYWRTQAQQCIEAFQDQFQKNNP